MVYKICVLHHTGRGEWNQKEGSNSELSIWGIVDKKCLQISKVNKKRKLLSRRKENTVQMGDNAKCQYLWKRARGYLVGNQKSKAMANPGNLGFVRKNAAGSQNREFIASGH